VTKIRKNPSLASALAAENQLQRGKKEETVKKKIIPLVSLLALIIVIIPVTACALLYPSSCPSSCPSSGGSTPSGSDTPSVNQPPVLNLVGNKVVNEGQSLVFVISATDPEGNELTYSVANLPAGANFASSSKTFSWTPEYDQTGTYPVTFTVSDGSLTDSETTTITVNNTNRPPVLNDIGNKTVSEGQLLTFMILATDPDGDSLTYSAGANFMPETMTFSWTPSYDDAGAYENILFEVFDGELTDFEEITITIVNVTLNATVDMDADTINLGAGRKWLTGYIELPAEYQPEFVDLSMVILNLNGGAIPAVTDPKYDFVTDPSIYIQDHDGDGVPERMVKFDWSLVKPFIELGENVLVVSGGLLSWPARPDFEGTDTVNVIE